MALSFDSKRTVVILPFTISETVLNKDNNITKIDISYLQNATYIATIFVDGKMIKAKKFLVMN